MRKFITTQKTSNKCVSNDCYLTINTEGPDYNPIT